MVDFYKKIFFLLNELKVFFAGFENIICLLVECVKFTTLSLQHEIQNTTEFHINFEF